MTENDIPYINESEAAVTLMVRDPWNIQKWYWSKGRSGITITLELGFVTDISSKTGEKRHTRS